MEKYETYCLVCGKINTVYEHSDIMQHKYYYPVNSDDIRIYSCLDENNIVKHTPNEIDVAFKNYLKNRGDIYEKEIKKLKKDSSITDLDIFKKFLDENQDIKFYYYGYVYKILTNK